MAISYEKEEAIIRAALKIAEKRMTYGDCLESPEAVRNYLRIWAAGKEAEVFGVIWLSSKHQVIRVEELFTGSIDSANIYPREVAKAGLLANAAAAIVFHNHPSGNEEPSSADRTLTTRLKEVLGLLDIRLLDHLVVGKDIASFSERGWL